MHLTANGMWFNEVATDLYPVGYYFADETNDFHGPYATDTAAYEAACAYVLTLG